MDGIVSRWITCSRIKCDAAHIRRHFPRIRSAPCAICKFVARLTPEVSEKDATLASPLAHGEDGYAKSKSKVGGSAGTGSRFGGRGEARCGPNHRLQRCNAVARCRGAYLRW